MERTQTPYILKDLDKKMVFLVGPRQVGKTWLAKKIGESFLHSQYLNYDRFEDRKIIQKEAWLDTTDLLILDELHKMPNWKNYLKGVYDTKKEALKILVTGSARLDIIRQIGDSLAGRFFAHHLMPFSPAELKNTSVNDMDRFIIRGGFPEPFLAESDIQANRWRSQYIDGLIREDIFDMNKIMELKALQLLIELLRNKVGSPISYSSLAEDIGISPNTVRKYIQILESLYIIFRIIPFSNHIARSLKKEPKIYFFDTGLVKGDKGAIFENFVAGCLLKYVYYRSDYEGLHYSLNYLRTKDGQEVDFCLVNENKIEQLIEVKYADTTLSKNLIYFNQKYQLPGIQLVKEIKREYQRDNLQVRDAHKFLSFDLQG